MSLVFNRQPEADGRLRHRPRRHRNCAPPRNRQKKGAGAKPAPASSNWYSHLALGDDRRWGFTLADVASAARDAEESKHRSRC
jgi:hypothetical protein